MLFKDTFYSDDELNIFLRLNSTDGVTNVYIVKFIVTCSPDGKNREYHVLYTSEKILASGMHMRLGVQ